MNVETPSPPMAAKLVPWALGAWVIVMLQFRPALIGDARNPLVFAVFACMTLTILLLYGKINPFRVSRDKWVMFLLIMLTGNYLLCQGLILSDAPETVRNSCIVILGSSICFYIILEKGNLLPIIKTFVYVHFVLGLSALATLVLFAAVGFNIDKLPIMTVLSVYDKGALDNILLEHVLFFPFTVIWSSYSLLGVTFPRFVGIYREPGMAQIFFFTAFFMAHYIPLKRPRLVKTVILIASFATFSTAGLLSFIGGYFCLKFFNRESRRSALTFLVPLALVVVVFVGALLLPNIGILAKAADVSGGSRLLSLEANWNAFQDDPWFGQGYYSGFVKDGSGKAVGDSFFGVIDVSRQIGGIGFLLYFTCWGYGIFRLGSRRSLSIYMPCFLTLWTQPSYNDVIVWFLLLLDTSKLIPQSGSARSPGGVAPSRIGHSVEDSVVS